LRDLFQLKARAAIAVIFIGVDDGANAVRDKADAAEMVRVIGIALVERSVCCEDFESKLVFL